MRTYRRSTGTGSNYDETMGTVGFVAVNSAGERIVITHGHDIASYGYLLKIGSVSGCWFNVLGTSNKCDASYATLGYGTLSRKISNISNTYVIGGLGTSGFESLSNPNVYYFGVATGGEAISYFTVQNEGTYKYLMSTSGTFVSHGNSGGPIYIKSSYSGSNTYVKIIGIVKAGQTSWSSGVLLDNIKNQYYSDTGYTLTVYASSSYY